MNYNHLEIWNIADELVVDIHNMIMVVNNI
jgi:hypothetical protein